MLRSNLLRPDGNGQPGLTRGRLQFQRRFLLVERTVSPLDGRILEILEDSHLKRWKKFQELRQWVQRVARATIEQATDHRQPRGWLQQVLENNKTLIKVSLQSRKSYIAIHFEDRTKQFWLSYSIMPYIRIIYTVYYTPLRAKRFVFLMIVRHSYPIIYRL